MAEKRPDGIEDYAGPAGGWDALRATAEALVHEKIVIQGSLALLKSNQPDGFDCP